MTIMRQYRISPPQQAAPPERSIGARFMRSALLRAGESKRVERFVARHGMRLGAKRFVPATSLEEIVPVIRDMNRRGVLAVTGLFDDKAYDEAAVARHAGEYSAQIARLLDAELEANIGLKLSHLGVYVDHELMFSTVRDLLEQAGAGGMKLRIDMEESSDVDATLDLYRRLRAAGVDNVGVVLQSYLRRSAADLESLWGLKPDIRIVKGAYLESEEVAFQRKEEVDRGFAELVERNLTAGGFTAIATHDERLIELARTTIDRLAIDPSRYEFQTLYGIRPRLESKLVAEGLRLRIACPYGPTWFAYLMRRLAERPANVGFVLRSLVHG